MDGELAPTYHQPFDLIAKTTTQEKNKKGRKSSKFCPK
jgi:hypothetical protein